MINNNLSAKILITGASGFIGKHLVRKLLKHNYKVICVDLTFDAGFVSEFRGKLQIWQGNMLDEKFITDIVGKAAPDYVFHLAGSKNRTNSLPEFQSSMKINYYGLLNLFDALLTTPTLKLITILGTIEEYGHAASPFSEDSIELPNSAYGLSKLSATKLALVFNRQFGLPVTVLRPSIAYGPQQGEEMFLPALIKSLLNKKEFEMTPGEQLRDFIYIDDLTDAMLQVINKNNIQGQIFNIASGASITIREVALHIAQFVNATSYLKIGETPYRKSEIMNYSVDVSKAASQLGWKPKTTMEEGLMETIGYYKRLDK